MTVSTSYAPLSYAGNGATTAFAVTWPFFTGTLVVTLVSSAGVETVKTLTTHYTVSGGTDADGLPATGTVTMLTAPAAGETLRIERVTPKTQASAWAANDAFPQKTVEAALDRLTLIAQEGIAAAFAGIGGDLMQLVTSGATDYWDAQSAVIRNVADAVESGDAVNYGQLQDVLVTAGTGDVVGPGSATDGRVVAFNGATGKIIKEGTKLESDLVTGPGSATDTAVALFDGATGKIIKNSTLLVSASGHATGLASVNAGPLAGFRNQLINGCMRVNQRLSATNADDTYAHDRWNILTQTGTVAVTTQTLIESGWASAMRITQSQASAQRFGVSQIIEAAQSQPLRGSAVTLSARVQMSASTTLRFAVLEWTGTADSVTSDVVNDWTSGTFTAGNFFNSTTLTVTATGSQALTANTAATVSLSTTLGTSTNNVIVIFWTDSTQAQNVTLDIGKVQLEIGSTATPFERRPLGVELSLCQRFYEKSFDLATAPAQNAGLAGAVYAVQIVGASTSVGFGAVEYKVRKRVAPTITLYNPSAANAEIRNTSAGSDWSSSGVHGSIRGEGGFGIFGTTAGGSSAGQAAAVHWSATAEL